MKREKGRAKKQPEKQMSNGRWGCHVIWCVKLHVYVMAMLAASKLMQKALPTVTGGPDLVGWGSGLATSPFD